MYTIIGLLALAGALAVIYKLLTHTDKTPDPIDKAEQERIRITDQTIRQAGEGRRSLRRHATILIATNS